MVMLVYQRVHYTNVIKCHQRSKLLSFKSTPRTQTWFHPADKIYCKQRQALQCDTSTTLIQNGTRPWVLGLDSSSTGSQQFSNGQSADTVSILLKGSWRTEACLTRASYAPTNMFRCTPTKVEQGTIFFRDHQWFSGCRCYWPISFQLPSLALLGHTLDYIGKKCFSGHVD